MQLPILNPNQYLDQLSGAPQGTQWAIPGLGGGVGYNPATGQRYDFSQNPVQGLSTGPGMTMPQSSPTTSPTTTPSPNANQINLGDLSSFFQNFLQSQQSPQGYQSGTDLLGGLGQYKSQLPYYSPG